MTDDAVAVVVVVDEDDDDVDGILGIVLTLVMRQWMWQKWLDAFEFKRHWTPFFVNAMHWPVSHMSISSISFTFAFGNVLVF
jgi:hypothetical protein